MTTQTSKFQALSAFTGVGFTTAESEQIVAHPVRRRVVVVLMILGKAGIATALASLLLTFMSAQETELQNRLGLLAAGLVILWLIAASTAVERTLARLIHRALERWNRLDVRDYGRLLRVSRDYQILELQVQPGDWMAGRSLGEMSLRDEGVLVLGINRASGRSSGRSPGHAGGRANGGTSGSYVGAPRGHTVVEPGDVLVVYGRDAAIERLDDRRQGAAGDQAHEHAVAEQRQILSAERRKDALRSAHEGRRAK